MIFQTISTRRRDDESGIAFMTIKEDWRYKSPLQKKTDRSEVQAEEVSRRGGKRERNRARNDKK